MKDSIKLFGEIIEWQMKGNNIIFDKYVSKINTLINELHFKIFKETPGTYDEEKNIENFVFKDNKENFNELLQLNPNSLNATCIDAKHLYCKWVGDVTPEKVLKKIKTKFKELSYIKISKTTNLDGIVAYIKTNKRYVIKSKSKFNIENSEFNVIGVPQTLTKTALGMIPNISTIEEGSIKNQNQPS